MQHKNLIEEFELELWQYLDQSLPAEKMQYWREKIKTIPDLQKILEANQQILDEYDEFGSNDLDDISFKKMIDVATSKKGLFEWVKSIFTQNENEMIPKLAFGSALIIAALVVLLISNKPNPINNLTNTAFGWEDEVIDSKFENINTKISLLENEDLRKYYMFVKTRDAWDREIISIDKELKVLIEKTESREL